MAYRLLGSRREASLDARVAMDGIADLERLEQLDLAVRRG